MWAAPHPTGWSLQSAAGGSAASLRIGVSGDATLDSLFAYDPAGTQNLTQTVAAQDANLTVNGVAITSGSNTLADAIQGVTLSLAKVGTTTVTIGRDPAAAQLAAQGFVKAYNDLNTLLHNLTRFDAENDGSGALVGDSAARTIQSQLRNALSSALAGGNGNTLRVLSQVGMSFQKDGSLALDSGKLSQALASDPAGVARLFASGGAASDSLVKVVGLWLRRRCPAAMRVEITQLATRGQLVGSTAAALTIYRRRERCPHRHRRRHLRDPHAPAGHLHRVGAGSASAEPRQCLQLTERGKRAGHGVGSGRRASRSPRSAMAPGRR